MRPMHLVVRCVCRPVISPGGCLCDSCRLVTIGEVLVHVVLILAFACYAPQIREGYRIKPEMKISTPSLLFPLSSLFACYARRSAKDTESSQR